MKTPPASARGLDPQAEVEAQASLVGSCVCVEFDRLSEVLVEEITRHFSSLQSDPVLDEWEARYLAGSILVALTGVAARATEEHELDRSNTPPSPKSSR